jgi:hypothetical protein
MKIIQNLTKELWREVADAAENATFFHTPTWADVITETFPQFSIHAIGAELDDSDIAILPAVATRERNRIFYWLESLYLGGYGGLISSRPLTAGEVAPVMKLMINNRIANCHIMGNPLREYELPSEFQAYDQFTHFLKFGEPDEVSQRMSSDKRRNIKKASEYKITCCVADTEDQYRDYFQVYENTLERWGEKTLVQYPYTLFASIFRYHSDQVKLWLAMMDNKVVCGKIIFYHRDFAYYWHGSSMKEYLNFYPDPFLMWNIILDGCQKGLKGMDMGPSGGLSGVEVYKEKFGAYKVPFHSYHWSENRVYKMFTSLKGAFRK